MTRDSDRRRPAAGRQGRLVVADDRRRRARPRPARRARRRPRRPRRASWCSSPRAPSPPGWRRSAWSAGRATSRRSRPPRRSGQMLLVQRYATAFARHGRTVGQVLLTADDVVRRSHYRNAQTTLDRLLALGVVPVVNENDAVATEEIRFGDNDRLAALVAHIVRADALVLLSDVDGLYDGDPRRPGARLVERVARAAGPRRPRRSAAPAAPGSAAAGCRARSTPPASRPAPACRCCCRRPPTSPRRCAARAARCSTRPAPAPPAGCCGWPTPARRAAGCVLDDGAVAAVVDRRLSLLPAGVTAVEGDFAAGDPVELAGADGRPVARGLVAYDAARAARPARPLDARARAARGRPPRRPRRPVTLPGDGRVPDSTSSCRTPDDELEAWSLLEGRRRLPGVRSCAPTASRRRGATAQATSPSSASARRCRSRGATRESPTVRGAAASASFTRRSSTRPPLDRHARRDLVDHGALTDGPSPFGVPVGRGAARESSSTAATAARPREFVTAGAAAHPRSCGARPRAGAAGENGAVVRRPLERRRPSVRYVHADRRAVHEALWHVRPGSARSAECRTATVDPDAVLDRARVAATYDASWASLHDGRRTRAVPARLRAGSARRRS